MELKSIQAALRGENLDGWLFFDHHLRDPLAYRILGFTPVHTPTRRWYYFIPAVGDPKQLVHRIESALLDVLPGSKLVYSGWNAQVDQLAALLSGSRRIAMQYSPRCAVPQISLVDGGTLELVRDTGVEVVTSANLVQLFEARWTNEQLEMHVEAGRRVDVVRAAAFQHIARAVRNGNAINEWDVNRFIRDGFAKAGLVTDHGPIVAVNTHMSDPHYEPQAEGSAPIRRGDAVLIDLWAKLDKPAAVYYDITWTGYCGAVVPTEIQSVFSAVTAARDQAVALVQKAAQSGESICGYQVDDAARSCLTERGLGEFFIHRTGHSIGEEVHGAGANMDNLETHDERRIIPETCFSVEPGAYLPEFGIRAEVNVYVGHGSAQVTGEIQHELVKII